MFALKRLALLALPLAFAPLPKAVAAALCPPPVEPWQCTRVDEAWQCSGNWALPASPPPLKNSADAPTDVRAQKVESADSQQFDLTGNVQISRGEERLSAPSASFNRESEVAVANGPVRLEDETIIAYATEVRSNLKVRSSELDNVRYALKDGRGNGAARSAIHQGKVTNLTDVSFTSCSGDLPAWQVRAKSIELEHDRKIGRARDFRLVLGKVPVFYWPYASFPLTDERKSGILSPLISVGSNGVDITVPYYLNLAPNYDLTLNNRLIQRRGFMFGGEFRYLGEASSANVRAAYLSHDRIEDRERYSANIDYFYAFNPNWYFNADLNKVSDDRYFEDLGDSLTDSATSVIASSAGFYGRGAWWQAGLSSDSFEIIDPANPISEDPYRRAPRVWLNALQQPGDFSFGLRSEIVNFERDADVTGQRIDLAPFIRYEWREPYAFIRPELSYRSTRYNLDRGTERRFSRNLPIASLDAGLYFDRIAPFGQPDWRQTLEPRVYYLRAPFRDQSAFPVFDTTELDFSFPQLFRNNRFSGADRQADANQVSVAVSSRLLDDSEGVEVARVSVGQIRYFEDSLVFLPELAPLTNSAGVWVAEASARLGRDWQASVIHQFDPELSQTRLSAIRIQKRFSDRGLANLGYRYRNDRLEQIDLSGLVPVNERWSLIGRWNYSLPESRTLEALGGFEYASCCWRLRLLGRHHVRAGTLDGKNSLYFELELNGLGSLGRQTGDLLRRAIVGFSELTPDR